MTGSSQSKAHTGWRAQLGRTVNKDLALATIIFFANFLVAKICIYGAPLAIAAIATGPVYGAIELAQSFGLLITSFLIGAPLAGITQVYLVKGEANVFDQLSILSAVFSALTLVVFALAWAVGFKSNILLVIAAFASTVIHNVAGTWFRMRGARNLTAWVDGTALLLSLLMVGMAIMLAGDARAELVTTGYLILAAVLTIASLFVFARTVTPGWMTRLIASTRIGIPMVIVGTMATWLGVGGRMTVGLLDATNVAAYGVAFRIAGLALGLHQLAATGLFAVLYRAKTRRADSIIALFLAGVCFIVFCIGFLGQIIIENFRFEALDNNGRIVFVQILPIVCLQTFYWIGYAMTQLRINRSRLAGKSIIPTAAIMLGGIAIIFGASFFFNIGISALCWMIALHAAAFFALNMYMLSKVGKMPHSKVTAVGILGGIALTLPAMMGPIVL